MTKAKRARQTTLEERTAIVQFCIANANNYALTAESYNCSYGQVYSWVKKYNESGVEGLHDLRGRRKPPKKSESSDLYYLSRVGSPHF